MQWQNDHRTSRAFRNIFRSTSATQLSKALSEFAYVVRQARQSPVRRTVWRPTVSGHTTRGFDSLAQHPFQNAPVATVPPPPSLRDNSGRVFSQATHRSQDAMSGSSSYSAAQRALEAVHGNSIPVDTTNSRQAHTHRSSVRVPSACSRASGTAGRP